MMTMMTSVRVIHVKELHCFLSFSSAASTASASQPNSPSSSPPTYYDILELPASCSSDDVHKAYRRLAKKYHPDLQKQVAASEGSPNASGSELFQKVKEAYDVLHEPSHRRAYDYKLRLQSRDRREDLTPNSSTGQGSREDGPAMRARKAAAQRIKLRKESQTSNNVKGTKASNQVHSPDPNTRQDDKCGDDLDEILNVYRGHVKNESHVNDNNSNDSFIPKTISNLGSNKNQKNNDISHMSLSYMNNHVSVLASIACALAFITITFRIPITYTSKDEHAVPPSS